MVVDFGANIAVSLTCSTVKVNRMCDGLARFGKTHQKMVSTVNGAGGHPRGALVRGSLPAQIPYVASLLQHHYYSVVES